MTLLDLALRALAAAMFARLLGVDEIFDPAREWAFRRWPNHQTFALRRPPHPERWQYANRNADDGTPEKALWTVLAGMVEQAPDEMWKADPDAKLPKPPLLVRAWRCPVWCFTVWMSIPAMLLPIVAVRWFAVAFVAALVMAGAQRVRR